MTSEYDNAVQQVLEEPELVLPEQKKPRENPVEEEVRTTDYSASVDQYINTQKTTAISAIRTGQQENPDEYAKWKKFSEDTNIPLNYVRQNWDTLQKKVQEPDYDALSLENPVASAFLAEHKNAAVAHDDVKSLMIAESVMKNFNSKKDKTFMSDDVPMALKSGGLDVTKSLAVLSFAVNASDLETMAERVASISRTQSDYQSRITPETQKALELFEKESGELDKAAQRFYSKLETHLENVSKESLTELFDATGEVGGELVDVLSSFRARQIGFGALQSLPQISITVGGTVAGAFAGGPAGAVAGGVTGGAISEFGLQFIQELEKSGVDTTDSAQIVSYIRGNPQKVADMKARAARKGFTTALVDQAFTVMGGRFLKGAGKSAKMSAKIKAGAKELGFQGVGEAAAEASGQFAKEGDVRDINIGEVIQEGVIGVASSGPIDTVTGLAIRAKSKKNIVDGIKSLVEAQDKSNISKGELGTLEGLVSAVKESKLLKRDPEALANLMNVSNDDASVFFQSDDWDDYWTQKGENPAAKADELLPGGVDQYEQAKANGQDLEIPTGDYATKIADTEDAKGLGEIVRTSPDLMNKQEINSFENEKETIVKELTREAKKEADIEAEFQKQAKDFKNDIKRQLKEAGRSNKEAEFSSQLWEARIKNRAELRGVTPKELISEFGITVQKGKEVSDSALFQDDGIKRGQIRIGDSKSTIELFEKANRSTFLHETGHAFLEDMRRDFDAISKLEEKTDIQERFIEDVQTVKEFLGVESLENLGTEQHEKMARGFESYLMEGKAPTKKLQRAFRNFATWLTNIYKSALNLDVKMNKDIREVFDRMLITQKELNSAESTMLYDEQTLEASLDSISATRDQKREIKQAHADAREEAERILYKENMKQARIKNDREYKSRRTALRKEWTQKADQLPVYLATDAMSKGLINGEKPIGYDTLKMNTAELKQLLSDEQFKRIPKNLYSQKGNAIDENAALLGFSNSKELLDNILANPTKKQYIETNVQNQLSKEFPDYTAFDDMSGEQLANIKKDSIDAVHSEQRGKALKMELDLLFKNSPAQAKQIIRAIVKRVPKQAEFKRQAEITINNTQLKNIKPHIYIRQENRNRMEAGKHLTDGDFAQAFNKKLAESVNHELFKKSYEVEKFTDKSIREIKKRYSKNIKDLGKTFNVDMYKASELMLSKYGLISDRKLADLNDYLAKLKEYDPLAHDKVKGLVDSLNPIESKPYKELTFSEFEQVVEVADSLYTLAREEKTIEVDGKAFEAEKALNEINESLAGVNKSAFKRNKFFKFIDKNPLFDLLSLEANMTRMEHLLDYLGGNEFDNPLRKYIWNRAAEAQQNYQITQEERYQKINDILDTDFKGIFKNETQVDVTNWFPNVDQENAKLTKSELVMALVHSGNESNLKKLLLGRGWGFENEYGVLDTSQYDRFINDMIENGTLTKKDFDGVQRIWDLFEEFKPAIQKTHKKVYGYFFKEIEAKPFTNKFGSYRGGYAPAITDPNLVEAQLTRENALSLEMEQNAFTFAGTPKGFTQERLSNYNKALSLDFSIIRAHVEKTTRFTEIQPALTDLNKLIRDKGFREQLFGINERYGSEAFDPWLARLATQQTETPADTKLGRDFANSMRFLRKNANMQLMFVNVINTMEQVGEVTSYFLEVQPKNMAKSTRRYVNNRKAMVDNVTSMSKYMKLRMENQIFEINDTYRDIINQGKGKTAKLLNMQRMFGKHAYILQQSVANVTDVVAWDAAFNQEIARGATDIEAARKADSVIRKVSGSNTPIDIANIEAGNSVQKALLVFYSFFLNKGNLVWHSSPKTKFKAYAFGIMAPAILSSIIRRAAKGTLDLDDDQEYIDDLGDIALMSQIRFVSAILPFGGSAMRFIEGKFTDQIYDDRLSLSPVVSMIEGSSGPVKLLTKDELRSKDVRDTLNFFGTMTGLPLGPAGRPIGFMIDVDQGKQGAENPGDYVRGLTTGRSGKK